MPSFFLSSYENARRGDTWRVENGGKKRTRAPIQSVTRLTGHATDFGSRPSAPKAKPAAPHCVSTGTGSPGTSKLTPYEKKREARIANNKSRLKDLGVLDAAKKVSGKRASSSSTSSSSRKRPAAPAAPQRRSSRPRKDVSYKEPTMKEFEEVAAAAAAGPSSTHAASSRAGYDPPEPELAFTPSLVVPASDEDEGGVDVTRDGKTGALVFRDHPEFRPNLTPKQVIRAGSWGGVYFHPRWGFGFWGDTRVMKKRLRSDRNEKKGDRKPVKAASNDTQVPGERWNVVESDPSAHPRPRQ